MRIAPDRLRAPIRPTMCMVLAITLQSAALAVIVSYPNIGIDRLTVKLTPDDRNTLSTTATLQAASVLEEHGVVLLKGALPVEMVDAAAEAVNDRYDTCREAVKARGIQLEEPFAYAEFYHRSKLRYDLQLARAATALPRSFLESPPWRPLLDKIIGDDYVDLFQGAVIAEPGAVEQQPHMDGSHLFQTTHGYEQNQNPPHCLNVFVPLVDVTEDNGPTEFWPGSHILKQSKFTFAKMRLGTARDIPASVRLAGTKGDVIIFDYRVIHRGRKNVAESSRPLLYLTSSRSWFRDTQNFPPERLLGA